MLILRKYKISLVKIKKNIDELDSLLEDWIIIQKNRTKRRQIEEETLVIEKKKS